MIGGIFKTALEEIVEILLNNAILAVPFTSALSMICTIRDVVANNYEPQVLSKGVCLGHRTCRDVSTDQPDNGFVGLLCCVPTAPYGNNRILTRATSPAADSGTGRGMIAIDCCFDRAAVT